jgi:hypothetical protein
MLFITSSAMTHFSFYDLPESDVTALPVIMRGTPENWASNGEVIRRYLRNWLDVQFGRSANNMFERVPTTDPVQISRMGTLRGR